MTFDPTERIFNALSTLIMGMVRSRIEGGIKRFFDRKRVENGVENAIARVVDSLSRFLRNEKITDEQQVLLVEVCALELKPLTDEPARLFHGSLNGQKVFDQLYGDRPYPQAIREEGLERVYALAGAQIAVLLCDLPATVEAWKLEGWKESFRRLDELGEKMEQLHARLDAVHTDTSRPDDPLFLLLRRAQTQKLSFDLTGLRADKPLSCSFEDMFIHPCLDDRHRGPFANMIHQQCESLVDARKSFLGPGARAVVQGPPGAGKSTWTLSLQRDFVDSGGIGVRLQLRGIGGEFPSANAVVRALADVHLSAQITHADIRRWLEAGQVAFLVDGFDELSPSRRDEALTWLKGLAAVAPGAHWC